MKSDFKQGDVLKISPELDTIYAEKESFCTTNLLAHDKITGFYRIIPQRIKPVNYR